MRFDMSALSPAHLREHLRDKRTRKLAILGGVTLACLILAALALGQRDSSLESKYAPHALFPQLGNRLADIGEITVKTRSSEFHVRYMDGKGWVVSEKHDFPADMSQVRATMTGMADLTTVMAKTTRAEWLRLLDLGAPEDNGKAVRISLADKAGQPVAAVLIGKQGPVGDPEGGELYVRLPGDSQSWLARGFLLAHPDIGDWLDKSMIDIPRARIQMAEVAPPTGPKYTVSRKTKDATYLLSDIPKGRVVAYDSAPGTPAEAISDFRFDDVAARSDVDFSKAAEMKTTTFDGLVLTTKLATVKDATWAAVTAEGTTADTKTEAAAINARMQNWAFKLPAYKADAFLSTKEKLLRPPGK